MADQSNFSKFPKKQLVYIASKIIDDGFDWQALNYDYEGTYDTNESILKNVSSYFNESAIGDDVQFFAKFLEINDGLLSEIFESNDKTLIEQLIIPQSSDYLVEYTVEGECAFIEYYDTKLSSYDKGWVMDSLQLQSRNGDWDYFSGTLKNTEYADYETQNWEIGRIKDIGGISESTNPKRLLENTEKLIPKLDRQTLIKLKYIIDKQLRGL